MAGLDEPARKKLLLADAFTRRAVTVLHAGRLWLEDQPSPIGVDHDLTLAALYLFARVLS